MPKLARHRTGNGIPYFVPACPVSVRGRRVMRFPATIVRMPCHHAIPAPHAQQDSESTTKVLGKRMLKYYRNLIVFTVEH